MMRLHGGEPATSVRPERTAVVVLGDAPQRFPPRPSSRSVLAFRPHTVPHAKLPEIDMGLYATDSDRSPRTGRNSNLMTRLGILRVQALSNGRYRSCVHRAVVHRERERRSLAFFLCPRDDRVVRPPPRLLAAGRDQQQQEPPRRYPDFTWADLARFTQLHYRADARTLDAFARWLGAPPTSSCAVATSASQSQDKAQETA